MKRAITTLLSFFCICALFVYPIFAKTQPDGCYRWYIEKTKDHSMPPCGKDLQVIAGYRAFYLNPNAKEDPVIYLTFDAGYENGNVEKILDTLSAHQVPGAFFILEHLVTANTDLVRRMVTDGHLVCNHTASHPDMSRIKDKETFQKELTKLEDIYYEKMGVPLAKFYRPPQGHFSKANLEFAQEFGYTTVFWSFAYDDWDNHRQKDPKKALNNLMAHLHNGEILLLHPTSKTNALILGDFIAQAKALGYRFGSLEELWNVTENLVQR